MHKYRTILALLCILLTACARQNDSPTPTPPQPVPTTRAPATRGTVTASGEIVPTAISEPSFSISGRVASVAVTEGDRVSSGDALVTLHGDHVADQIALSEAALAVARADLEAVTEGASAQEIAVAEAAVESAEARHRIAKGQWEATRAAIERAECQVIMAREAVDDLTMGPTALDVAVAQAAVRGAENTLWGAQAARDSVGGAHARGHAGDAERDQAEANVGVAYEALQLARLELERLQAPARAQVVAQSQANVCIAETVVAEALTQRDIAAAQMVVAAANLKESRARLARVRLGASPAQVARAQALVAQAETSLAVSRDEKASLVLAAPLDGTIVEVSVSPGKAALPGQALLTVADLDHLQVETTDLSERDVARIGVGHAATVYVKALGVELAGHVERIAPRADTLGGDVVYATMIALDETHPALRWGMSVEASIDSQ